MTNRRLTDRRTGSDRRAAGRRRAIIAMIPERREVVDRRCGAERRSTLDRRRSRFRTPATETPGEHVRNALQLLNGLVTGPGLGEDRAADLAAALTRLRRALDLLERRP